MPKTGKTRSFFVVVCLASIAGMAAALSSPPASAGSSVQTSAAVGTDVAKITQNPHRILQECIQQAPKNAQGSPDQNALKACMKAKGLPLSKSLHPTTTTPSK